MRKTVLFAALLSLLLVGSFPCWAEEEGRGLKVGDALPSRTLSALNGEPIPLPAPEGLTVLVFWSTWSPRSEPLLAYWAKTREGYAASNHPFALVTVNADHQEMDGEKLSVVKTFLSEKGFSFPVAVDESLGLYNTIGVKSLPTTFFLKADGTLLYEAAGFPSSASGTFGEELDRHLGIAREVADTGHGRGKLSYQPKNNALLYFGMGQNLAKMKMREKARAKYVESLSRDPDFADPLKALEADFFKDGRTPEAAAALRDLLLKGNLGALAERYAEGAPAPEPAPAPEGTPAP